MLRRAPVFMNTRALNCAKTLWGRVNGGKRNKGASPNQTETLKACFSPSGLAFNDAAQRFRREGSRELVKCNRHAPSIGMSIWRRSRIRMRAEEQRGDAREQIDNLGIRLYSSKRKGSRIPTVWRVFRETGTRLFPLTTGVFLLYLSDDPTGFGLLIQRLSIRLAL